MYPVMEYVNGIRQLSMQAMFHQQNLWICTYYNLLANDSTIQYTLRMWVLNINKTSANKIMLDFFFTSNHIWHPFNIPYSWVNIDDGRFVSSSSIGDAKQLTTSCNKRNSCYASVERGVPHQNQVKVNKRTDICRSFVSHNHHHHQYNTSIGR